MIREHLLSLGKVAVVREFESRYLVKLIRLHYAFILGGPSCSVFLRIAYSQQEC